jgi:hypothetical protein
MEVALARLVGAGLTLVFEGFEEPAPAGAVEGGLHLIRHIAGVRPDLAAGVMEGVVRDIWREWRQGKLPQDVAIQHIEALPELMERCRSSDGMMLGAVAAIQVARRIGSAARPVNHCSRVASAIVGRAIETGYLTGRGLNESLAFFFLDRLLARLMPDQQLFIELRPLFRDYLEYQGWTGAHPPAAASHPVAEAPSAAPQTSGEEPVADAASAAAATADAHAEDASIPASIRQVAAATGVPAVVLAPIAARAATRLGPLPASMVEDLALGLREMLSALDAPDDGDAEAASLKRRAGEAVRACQLETADQLLGEAEDIHLRAAPQDLAMAHVRLAEAAAIRSKRAQLEELVADFRRAARHYASAARCLPDTDRRGRRGFLMRQAGALVAQGEMAGETAALAEAAQAYADAGRLLSEQENPQEWANAHLELGRILCELGEREGRSERYLAAALHFKPAADVLSRLKQADGWARAQLGIADALRAQGEVQGDVVTLNEAAFAYRAALGVATRDRMPAEWSGASARLAATLLRLDQETGETQHHEEAVMALRAVLSTGGAITEDVRCTCAARLAGALLTLAGTHDDPVHAEEALTLVRQDYANAVQALPAGHRARHDDQLGTGLRQLAVKRASVELMSEAIELKLAALDTAQRAGEGDVAARLQRELSEMEGAVAALKTGKFVAAGAAA